MTKQLTLPIEFYIPKHIIWFLMIVSAICFVGIFIDTFFDYFAISHRGQLPYFVKVVLTLVMGGCLLLSIKILFSNIPNIILKKDSIGLLNLFKKEYEFFEFAQIKTIEFAFDETPRLYIYLKDRPILSNADKTYPLNYYTLNGKTLHSKQVADIISQVFDNYKNDQSNPIVLKKLKNGFKDWIFSD